MEREKTPERVLVCGGRDFGRTTREKIAFDAQMILLDWDMGVRTIIHGGARGADTLAAGFAKASGKAVVEFKADWAAHGRAAGPIRNQRMLDEGRPDHVIAFPGGRGTADMVARARAAGIPVQIVSDEDAGRGPPPAD